MQVGTTKDQGLYNKPSAAVRPGALAAGTLPQYNTQRQVLTSNQTPQLSSAPPSITSKQQQVHRLQLTAREVLKHTLIAKSSGHVQLHYSLAVFSPPGSYVSAANSVQENLPAESINNARHLTVSTLKESAYQYQPLHDSQKHCPSLNISVLRKP